jgi:hypothetical protein
MLSATIRLPARVRRSAHSRYSGLLRLSASMKTRSNGPASVGSVSIAAPTRTSTTSAKPARSTFARATSAWRGFASNVTSRPPGGSARASQIVLYPPSVPISRIARAPWRRASSSRSLPCSGETSWGGRPAAELAASAASSAGSGATRRSTR